MLFVLGVGGVRQVTLILLLSFPFAHLVPPSQFIAVWLVFPVFHWNPYCWPPLYTPRVPFETMLSLKLSHLTLSSPVLGCLLPLWLALAVSCCLFPVFLVGWGTILLCCPGWSWMLGLMKSFPLKPWVVVCASVAAPFLLGTSYDLVLLWTRLFSVQNASLSASQVLFYFSFFYSFQLLVILITILFFLFVVEVVVGGSKCGPPPRPRPPPPPPAVMVHM